MTNVFNLNFIYNKTIKCVNKLIKNNYITNYYYLNYYYNRTVSIKNVKNIVKKKCLFLHMFVFQPSNDNLVRLIYMFIRSYH